MPNMYEEYLTHYKTYIAKFGPKVAIFLMVGIFYEMYDERDPETGQTKTTLSELVDLLGLKVSIKKGEGPSGSRYDGLVAGIPDYTVHKWSARLTQLGWTVVLIEQIKNPAGKVIDRKVQRILTPGSHVEAITEYGSSTGDLYLTFVTITSDGLNRPPLLATAAIDLTTGYLHVFETVAQGTEDAWTCDSLVQFMELYPPKEVLWSCQGTQTLAEQLTESKLKSILGCRSDTTFHQRNHLGSGAWLNPTFREEYLRTRCGLKTLLPTNVALYMREGSQTETALISLLNALEELWPSMKLGSLIVFPWIPGQQMRLGENALVQLHMIVQADARQDVLSLFDKCATPMGRRGLRDRLLKPSADATTIKCLLDAVDAWYLKDADYREVIQRRMRSIVDMDRMYRRIQQGQTTAIDLIGLDNSLKALDYIAEKEGAAAIQATIGYLRSEVFKIFDVTKAYQGSDDLSLFVGGVVPETDAVEVQIQAQIRAINEWLEAMRRLVGVAITTDTFKLDYREKTLVVKAPRAIVQTLKISGKLGSDTTAVVNKTGSYLESAALDQIYATVLRLRESLNKRQAIALVEKGYALAGLLFQQWHAVTDWIKQADVNLTLAKVARDLGYVKPTIVDSDLTASVAIEGLRHPLLEAQDRRVPYVQHSVSLGLNGVRGSGEGQGWLLYGLNASGKSTMMRSVGLAVLLAQGGSFVPASKMTLAPFQSLHTRIINTDNLWMGLSSFAVEMSEMREIFRDAGPRSLVLGDELCSGTETTSATALVAAGIKGLLNRGARFLFATHLHGLTGVQEVMEHSSLKVWHLHVEYDPIKDKLVYHRLLKPGPGSSLYGLEVAKAMRIPADILEDAIRFRKQLAGEAELSESVGSAWNTSVIRRTCQKCGKSEVGNLETHHIRERHTANSAGRLGDGSSVHALANLAVLCDGCHDAVHRGETTVKPLIQTSDGPEESVESPKAVESPKPVESPEASLIPSHVLTFKQSKWSEEELTTIRSVCREMKHLKNTILSEYLLNTHNITISAPSLKKFR
jgi:DNA mismatch repair protein MutS